MTDTIIKGTGNSRSLKSVPNLLNLAPTYEEMVALLTGEGLPIDLSGPNADGCDVVGSLLTKANLLPDSVCSNLGIAYTSELKDALERLRSLISTAQSSANSAASTASGRARTVIGTYSGNGALTKTLNFSFRPSLVLVAEHTANYTYSTPMIYGCARAMTMKGSGVYTNGDLTLSWGSNSVTWTALETGQSVALQSVGALNGHYTTQVGATVTCQYYYIAIG